MPSLSPSPLQEVAEKAASDKDSGSKRTFTSGRDETQKRRFKGTLATLILGALVFFPAVRAPLFLDDFLQGAMVEGTFPGRRGIFNLYDFVDDGDRAALMERGLLPWWTDETLTIRFFRPLSSALLFLDHRVFSHAALPMHLHSLLWWALAVLATRRLFRNTFEASRPTMLATAIFALAPCHALPLAWIANRETLVSLTFGALGLAAHARWIESFRLRDAAIAAAFFALALLGGGEYALSFGGYILAMALVGGAAGGAAGSGGIARRVMGCAPFALSALAYLLLRASLAYGTKGSGFYSDPVHNPIAFLMGAPMRAITLLGSGWLTIEPESWRTGVMRWVLVAMVLTAAVMIVPAIRRAFGRLGERERRSASWMLYGSMFSLVPTLAVVPSRRLLGTSMIGVAMVVALVIDRMWFPTPSEGEEGQETKAATPLQSRIAAAISSLVALLLGFAHLVHGPGTAWLASRRHQLDGMEFAGRVAFIRNAVGGEPTRGEIGVVRGLTTDFFEPFALDSRGRLPAKWMVLAQTGHVLALRRDERTIELIVPPNRSLFPQDDRNLYRRTSESPMRVGDEFRVPGLHVTITTVGDVGPRAARIVFDRDPDTYTWITADFEETRAATLPKVGFGAPFDPRGPSP